MLYELPATLSDPVVWLQWTNQITGYWFGPGIVLAFFLIMFIAFKSFTTDRAFAASSLLATILCFLFFLLGLTSVPHLFLASVSTMFSLFLLRGARGGE